MHLSRMRAYMYVHAPEGGDHRRRTLLVPRARGRRGGGGRAPRFLNRDNAGLPRLIIRIYSQSKYEEARPERPERSGTERSGRHGATQRRTTVGGKNGRPSSRHGQDARRLPGLPFDVPR